MNFITIILSLYITISISAPRYLSEEFIEKMNNRIKVHERNNKFAATVVSLQNLTPRQAFEKGILAYKLCRSTSAVKESSAGRNIGGL